MMKVLESFKKDWKYHLELIFKIEFLFYLCCYHNNLFWGKQIMSAFVIASAVLGGLVIATRLMEYKQYKNTKLLFSLLAFLVSYVITIALNVRYGFLPGVKNLVWTALQLLVVYTYRTNQPPSRNKREFQILSYCYLVYMFLASFWSLVQFRVGYSSIQAGGTRGSAIPSGFMWGRLWGVFTDPNQGSVFACLAILMSIYFAVIANRKSKSGKWLTVFHCLNILAQLLYISFSDSRTGMVCLAAGVAFLLYTVFLRKIRISRSILRYATCMALSAVVCLTVFLLPSGVRVANNYVEIKIYEYQQKKNPGEKDPPSDNRFIGRKEDLEGDISNRRFCIWESSLEVFKTKPIFGVSQTNLVSYVYKELPDTYLVNNNLYEFDNSHNMFLDVLTGQGVIGFLILMQIMISALLFIFKRIWKLQGEDYFRFTVMLSCIATAVVSCFFMTEIFYINSPIAFLFWFMLGSLNYHLSVSSAGETAVVPEA